MVCSLAKFLALGLIASEGHGPVSVGALDDTDTAKAAKTIYKNIVGVDHTGDKTVPEIRIEICNEMYTAYKTVKPQVAGVSPKINGTVITGMSIEDVTNKVTVCDKAAFLALKEQMLKVWKDEAARLRLNIDHPNLNAATIDGAANDWPQNVKKLVLDALLKHFKARAGANAYKAMPSTSGQKYYTQIKTVLEAWEAVRGITEREYNNIVGVGSGIDSTGSTYLTNANDVARMQSACRKMNEAHKEQTKDKRTPEGQALNGWTAVKTKEVRKYQLDQYDVKACTFRQFGEFKEAMIKVWKKEVTKPEPLTGWKLDTDDGNNIKMALIKQLKDDFKRLAGTSVKMPHSSTSAWTAYYKQIKALRDGVQENVVKVIEKAMKDPTKNKQFYIDLQQDSAVKDYAGAVALAKAGEAAFGKVEEAMKDSTKNKQFYIDLQQNSAVKDYAGAVALAKAVEAAFEKEELDIGLGFLTGGIVATLVTIIVFLLPCVAYDWKNGKFEGDDGYEKPGWLQQEAFESRNDANRDLNEMFELDIPMETGRATKVVEEVSAPKSLASGALTLVVVPAGALVVGGCLVVARRRGLKKRRAQKARSRNKFPTKAGFSNFA